MTIQVLGTGCPKCKKMTENVEAALKLAGVEAQIEKVTSVSEIAKFGAMFTPALAIDGKLKAAGKVLPPEKIVDLIKANQT
jgi:small redox-active disulfide protein 2